jgi:hypothetical protein
MGAATRDSRCRRIIVHVQDRDARGAAEHHHATVSSALKRFADAVGVRLKPKPDLSLMNEKFTDSFERERTELLLRNRW